MLCWTFIRDKWKEMSVEVKTPTKTQFEHTEFQCGDKKRGHSVSAVTDGGGPAAVGRPVFNRQTSENIGVKYGRKRRYSERAGGDGSRERYLGVPGPKRRFSRGGRGPPEKIVLPTKFLLGGNINDPLNLNSLSDESVNKALNENTPKSSPLAVPYHRQHVHVIIPPNIEDPLGLNSGEDPALLSPKSMGKKKKRNKHKRKSQGERPEAADVSEVTNASSLSESKDFTTPVHIEIFSDSELPSSTTTITPGENTTSTPVPPSQLKLDTSGGSGPASYPPEKVVDHIVSPVIPQLTSPKSRRRKRTSTTSSDGKPDGPTPARLSLWEDGEKGPKPDKTSPHRPKFKRQHSHSSSQSQPTTPTFRPKPKNQGGKRNRDRVFIYGNYNQYYGYRNPDGSEKDNRLKNLKQEWFNGKDVLDIGCNAGHVTLEIARNFNPRKITGIDIDSSLIGAAKKNIRHYLTSQVARRRKYPSSLVASFGPIAAPPVKTSEENTEFPNNVSFVTVSANNNSDLLKFV